MRLLNALREQRLDDHRYYHHSRVNQSLHLFSAFSFIIAYVFVVIDPIVSVLMGWLVAMWSRQIGHFFFEPKGYDELNTASHEYKEDIKIGYNLKRKVILLSVWALMPVLLLISPGLFDLMAPADGLYGFVYNVSVLWLCVAAAGLAFRTVQLFFIRDVQTGLVWFIKIATDPFNDIKLYYKSPLFLLKGERIDPMFDVRWGIESGAIARREESSRHSHDDAQEPSEASGR